MKCSECERVEHVPSCSSANVSPSAERILLDLIAEINDKNHGCCGCGWADEAADRAEARLREVQGE